MVGHQNESMRLGDGGQVICSTNAVGEYGIQNLNLQTDSKSGHVSSPPSTGIACLGPCLDDSA